MDIKGRQIEMFLFLLRNKKTTYRELATLFEVSTKTIERDIDVLSSIGVPVYCMQGSGGGVYIDPDYTLSKSFLSKNDLHDIIFALNAFESISQKSYKEDILKKLCLISPELTALFDSDANDYLIVDLMEDSFQINKTVEENINKSMDEWVNLRITVKDKELQVSPISYVLKPKGVYLYCFDGEYKLIPLNDISDSCITDIEFERNFIPYREYVKQNNR